MLKSARMSVIKNCITQLTIITSSYKAHVERYPDDVLIYKTLGERYGFHVKTKYGETKLGDKYANHHKIQKDVQCIIHLLEELKEDLEVFGAASTIDTFIENYYRMKADEAELMIELAGKRETYKELVKISQNIRGNTRKCFEEMNKLITQKAVEMKDEMGKLTKVGRGCN
ncbi:unnamed protein product [Tenebrio molitor]|nr:unnamed protein product [Tenebrio molitor]